MEQFDTGGQTARPRDRYTCHAGRRRPPITRAITKLIYLRKLGNTRRNSRR